MTLDSYSAFDLVVGDDKYGIFRLTTWSVTRSLRTAPHPSRTCSGARTVRTTADDIAAPPTGSAPAPGRRAVVHACVLMQDFTGVPAIVDLAAMRDAVVGLGGSADRVEPTIPVDLVIDHSIVVDVAGVADAFARNVALEYGRNEERYTFLRWAQDAFRTLRVFPPSQGICHQVNLEFLAQVVFRDGTGLAYPDTLVGTDSHTPMVNGLGVLGWGVGGIEAEAAMLGQPLSLLLPAVVGIELRGALPEGATATDLVLTVAQLLRKHGVVGKFVEFYGEGVGRVPVENRATIGNMSPEYGSTCTLFPVDDETLRYLRATGRPDDLVALVETYAKEQGLWHDPAVQPVYDESLVLDLSTVEPSLAGPSPAGSGGVVGRVEFEKALLAFRQASGARIPATCSRYSQGVPTMRPAESFPASDPPAASEGMTSTGQPDTQAAPEASPAGLDRASSLPGDAHRRHRDGSRRRTRRDRRDHIVHEHVEPVGDDRRRLAGAAHGRARLTVRRG
jgi:aconitate hydratase